jgi:hypothetical protein
MVGTVEGRKNTGKKLEEGRGGDGRQRHIERIGC